MKYLLLLFVLVGCGVPSVFRDCKLEYKFKYKQKVRVTSGFYAGAVGEVFRTVVAYRPNDCNVNAYIIKFDNSEFTFLETELQIIK